MCSARAPSACQAEIANMTIQNGIQDFSGPRIVCFYFPDSVAREIRYGATFETAFMLSSNMGLWSEIKFPMIMNS